MRKTVLVLVILALVAGIGAAQWRADIGVDIPWTIGAQFSDAFGETGNETVNVLSEITLLLPEVMIGFEAQVLDMLNIGIGARVFTFIVESLAYPNAFVEAELGPVAVNLQFGGGAFLAFGLFNNLGTENIWIPDLSAHLMLGPSFRVGLGAARFMSFGASESFTIIYVSGKFVVRF